MFDLNKFDEYREDNRREVKRATSNIPVSLWDTYSAFANCSGGVIILGVKERPDGSWYTTGLKDPARQLKQFWDTINNKSKVSLNLLTSKDVEIFEKDGDTIIVIHVPMARREQRPVYINNDLMGGTFRRDGKGDYHCTPAQIKVMLRDQTEDTMDMTVLDDFPLEDLNQETIQSYRNRHRILREGHPFERLNNAEYLRSIGAAALSREDGKLHPTAAGMLMFGDEYNIIRYFPNYFLDYQETLDPVIRWTDRLHSSSGDWPGNVCEFYFRVYNKIIKDVKVPFKMSGGDRIDDTPVHRALREALANCLINTDFFGTCGVVIRKKEDRLILENPGYIRTGKFQMRQGGVSDPRNKVLMKMFNLISIGERAGSGVPNIFMVWQDEGWEEPVIKEQFNPDRTILELSFQKKVPEKNARKKVPEKSAEKKCQKKVPEKTAEKNAAQKTQEYRALILSAMNPDTWYKAADFADLVPVKERRLKEILHELVNQGDIEIKGATKGRRYRLVSR